MSRLVWFEHDLRIEDNLALYEASRAGEPLLCVYCQDPTVFAPHNFGFRQTGEHRRRFIAESLRDLDERLARRGQALWVIDGRAIDELPKLIRKLNIKQVYKSWHPGVYEQKVWRQLQVLTPNVEWRLCDGNTLFPRDFIESHCHDFANGSFSRFRKKISHFVPHKTAPSLMRLPPPIADHALERPAPLATAAEPARFIGGENAALTHLTRYFASNLPNTYLDTRNALMGEGSSSTFSPWLANGCLSVRAAAQALQRFESEHGKSLSTGWLYQELLWREFFYWYSALYKNKLFKFEGKTTNKPKTSHYSQRLKAWCEGNTPWPLVNACMRELNATGFISNRGRQIVASCLVNELAHDWRYGAAYFEQQLVDYDLGANWGNWQYIAGVGADSRGGRHFNLDKQQQQFDADGSYRRRWLKSPESPSYSTLDFVDAADWPI